MKLFLLEVWEIQFATICVVKYKGFSQCRTGRRKFRKISGSLLLETAGGIKILGQLARNENGLAFLFR